VLNFVIRVEQTDIRGFTFHNVTVTDHRLGEPRVIYFEAHSSDFLARCAAARAITSALIGPERVKPL
jgi:hypothetical protein